MLSYNMMMKIYHCRFSPKTVSPWLLMLLSTFVSQTRSRPLWMLKMPLALQNSWHRLRWGMYSEPKISQKFWQTGITSVNPSRWVSTDITRVDGITPPSKSIHFYAFLCVIIKKWVLEVSHCSLPLLSIGMRILEWLSVCLNASLIRVGLFPKMSMGTYYIISCSYWMTS